MTSLGICSTPDYFLPPPPNRTPAAVYHAVPMKYKRSAGSKRTIRRLEFWASAGCCKKLEGLVNWHHHSLSTWQRRLTLHTGYALASESSAPWNTTGTDDSLQPEREEHGIEPCFILRECFLGEGCLISYQ
ncbi:hypothetical protein BGX38DRAFT_586932 [Terfezia claveryi]|nr:hypothetical protein BGX38DRAFT_586932 [Terfezia claveryi]